MSFSKENFKTEYEKNGPDRIEWQLPHLQQLAEYYIDKVTDAKSKANWDIYLKAHGLLNSCIIRCSSAEDVSLFEQKIFDLERHWYGGQHPLKDIKGLRELTSGHKIQLAGIRNNSKTAFQDCKCLIDQLEMDDMFSECNERLGQAFAQQVKGASECCSREMIDIARRICTDSERLVGTPPCRYAVVALGSIARGEATPYSDLEYAILIDDQFEDERSREYFTKLAVDTYFRISNLAETPLKYYYIEELYDNYKEKTKEKLWFQDKGYSGFRIDGLLPNAGNIPTGNGLSEESLIVTVTQLIDRYKTSVNVNVEDVSQIAGIADILFSIVEVHSHNDEKGEAGQELLGDFQMEKMYFEQELSESNASRQRIELTRTRRIFLDVKEFDFCPGDLQKDMRLKCVKRDIFRYPTILALNLKIALAEKLESCETAWDVFEELGVYKMFTEETRAAMQFILMSAIWIRTSAYLYGDTQREYLSFHTKNDKEKMDDRFFVPKKLYIAMACRLVPIKQCISEYVCEERKDMGLDNVVAALANIKINKFDFILRGRLHYVCGDYKGGLEHITTALQRDITSKPSEVLSAKRVTCEEDTAQLIAYLLFHTGDYAKAIPYFDWLCQKATDNTRESCLYCASLHAIKAQCLMMLGKYEEAKELFDVAGGFMKRVLGAENREEVMIKLFSMVAKKLILGALDKKDDELVLVVSVNAKFIADSVRYHQGRYKSTKKSFENLKDTFSVLKSLMSEPQDSSLVVADFEMSIGLYNLQLAHYGDAKKNLDKASKIYTKVFGESAASIDQSAIQVHLGTLSLKCAEYDRAEELGMSALSSLENTEQRSPSNLLACHQLLADVYLQMGKYLQSTQQVKICKKIIQECSLTGYVLTDAIAQLTNAQIEYQVTNIIETRVLKIVCLEHAKETVLDVLTLLKQTVHNKVKESHPEVATAERILGQIWLALEDSVAAKSHAEKALDGFQKAYGDTASHPDIAIALVVLGQVCINLGKLSSARDHIHSAISKLQEIHGNISNHPNIAEAYYALADLEMKCGNSANATKLYTKALQIVQRVFGEHSNHPLIAKYQRSLDGLMAS